MPTIYSTDTLEKLMYDFVGAVATDVKAIKSDAVLAGNAKNKAEATTLAAFLALAGSSSLVPNRVYHITDTKQIAIPSSASAYDLWNRAGEQGFVVSATAPAAPYVGQVWLKVP